MRRIKFVWGASKVIKGHWYLGLLGFYDRIEGEHDSGLAISVRGALLWFSGALVAMYLVGFTAVFWFWQRNPYNQLSYVDALTWPMRRAAVHDKQGQAFIAQGTDALRAKRWAEGVSYLRQGLTSHPTDLRARLTLAQFYIASNQRPLGLKLLREGLTDDFPGRAYLQGLFDAAEQGEDYGLVVRTCDRYLSVLKGDAATRDRRWLILRKFAALQGGHQFAEVLALADTEGPTDVADENRVLALLGLERREEALKFLAGWRGRPGADVRQVLRLTVRTLRELKRFDEMERALEELREMSPSDPRPIVFGLVQQALAGRDAAAKAALENYLFRFGGSSPNLLFVAQPLEETGNLPLLERCVAAATERGYPLQQFRVLLVQTQVLRGEWAAARRTLALMQPPPTTGRMAVEAAFWRDWMARLLEAASLPSDTAPVGLLEFLRSRPWPMTIFRKSIDALRLAGRFETARDAVALAERTYPESGWLQKQKEEIAQAILAQQAKPSESPAVATPGRLPTEAVFFQQLEERLLAGQWTDAEQLLRDERNAKPAPRWAVSRDGDLRFAQLRISHGLGEIPEMLAAASLCLNGGNERSQKVLDFARAIFEQGDKTGAVALCKEVLRKSPDYPPAQKLMKEWQPRPAPQK